MKNKNIAIILAVVALVVVGLFVIKPLLIGQTEMRTVMCSISGEKFDNFPVKVGSTGPYVNPKTGQPTLLNAYLAKWKTKDGKIQEKWIIEGKEFENHIDAASLIYEPKKQ